MVNCSERFKIISNAICSNEIKEYTHLDNKNSFTRKRKMLLNDIILCTLCKKGLTTVMELRQYFLQKDNKIINISKQGYLQQRRRLNYKVFSLLNKKYLQDFYLNDNKILWNGYLVFAVDGSKVEVPNSNENKKSFGQNCNKYGKGETRALKIIHILLKS